MKLNQLSSRVRMSILNVSTESSESREQRLVVIDLSKFMHSETKLSISYFAQCVIDHF